MGVCLEVWFVWGNGNEYKKNKFTASIFAQIDMDKELYELYDNGIFELDSDNTDLTNVYVNGKHYKDDETYGSSLRLMPSEKLLEFIESKRNILCQEKEYYSHTGDGKYIPYFQPRVQALIEMLKALKDHSVILHWT